MEFLCLLVTPSLWSSITTQLALKLKTTTHPQAPASLSTAADVTYLQDCHLVSRESLVFVCLLYFIPQSHPSPSLMSYDCLGDSLRQSWTAEAKRTVSNAYISYCNESLGLCMRSIKMSLTHRDIESNWINRLVEGPGKLMSPQDT